MDISCDHKEYEAKELPNKEVIDVCKLCGMSRLKSESGDSPWVKVDINAMIEAIEDTAVKIDHHEILQRLLSNGYVQIVSKKCKAMHYKYDMRQEQIAINYNSSSSFFLSKQEMVDIMADPSYLPKSAQEAFDAIVERINSDIDFFEEGVNRNVHILFGLLPTKSLFNSLTTSISDPSTGIVINLEGSKENDKILWIVNVIYGLIWGEERKSNGKKEEQETEQ